MNYSAIGIAFVAGLNLGAFIANRVWRATYRKQNEIIKLQDQQINTKDEIIQMLKRMNDNKDQLLSNYEGYMMMRKARKEEAELN